MINDYNNGYNYGNYYNQQPQQGNPYNNPQVKQYSFVNGMEGAKAYQMGPNQSMLLMDADKLMCYMKNSDQSGKCSLRYFKLTEMDEAAAREFLQPSPVSQNNYVSKEEFDNLNKKMDEIMRKLDRYNKKENKENA